jgi:hypothetical protein
MFSSQGVALNVTTGSVQLRVLHNSVYLFARLKLRGTNSICLSELCFPMVSFSLFFGSRVCYCLLVLSSSKVKKVTRLYVCQNYVFPWFLSLCFFASSGVISSCAQVSRETSSMFKWGSYTVCPGSVRTVFIKNTRHELFSKFHSFYWK